MALENVVYIDQLQADGARMAAASGATSPHAPVPSCPEWDLRELIEHQSGVHRWATAFVAGKLTNPEEVDFNAIRQPLPDDDGLVDWFSAGHATLVTALRSAPPDVACWSFMPAPSPLAFWCRRQAHETAVHRADAELAAGRTVTAVDPTFASDGIDEMLLGFVQRRRGGGAELATRTLLIRCTDVEGVWRVTLGPDGVVTVPGEDGASAECVVSGPASDVYYALWNRRGIDGLRIEGDPALLDLLLGRTQVRWVGAAS